MQFNAHTLFIYLFIYLLLLLAPSLSLAMGPWNLRTGTGPWTHRVDAHTYAWLRDDIRKPPRRARSPMCSRTIANHIHPPPSTMPKACVVQTTLQQPPTATCGPCFFSWVLRVEHLWNLHFNDQVQYSPLLVPAMAMCVTSDVTCIEQWAFWRMNSTS